VNRKNLILIPGLLCNGRVFKHQFQNLIQDVDVEIADTSRGETMEEIARAILENTPARFAVAGHSMGGAIAFQIWKQAAGRVERLALLDTSPLPDSPPSMAQRREMIRMAEEKKLEEVARLLLPRLLNPGHQQNAELVEAVVHMARETPADVFIRHQHAQIKRPDCRELLVSIDCPTLVLVGRDDRLTPPEISEEMARVIPNAVFKSVNDSGHLTPVEQPESVTAALREWLEI
jgi:pimeloyl-ACP methyl ester carboxylesterase